MTNQPSPDESLKITKEVISGFLFNFRNPEGSRLKWAIENLFKEINRELDRLISGRRDLTATSIQVRNLFELYLITKHIYTSEKGLDDWFGQLHKDQMDVQNGFIDLFASHDINIKELLDIKEFSVNNIEDSPYSSKGGFNIKELADEYGHGKEYAAVHKLCSKLIHPTSLKVNLHPTLHENNNHLALLVIFGALFCQHVEELAHKIEGQL